MSRHFTVQCSAIRPTMRIPSPSRRTPSKRPSRRRIEAANQNPDGWRSTDHVTDSFVDAVCQGADRDPWGEGALPVPDRFTERGEPPVVTLTGPVRHRRRLSKSPVAGSSSASATEAGTVTSARLCDPPHPPGNKPLVTVSVAPDGKPLVKVEGGKAGIRILDS